VELNKKELQLLLVWGDWLVTSEFNWNRFDKKLYKKIEQMVDALECKPKE